MLGALALTACSSTPADNGLSSLDGRGILDQALANAKTQTSVHLVGRGKCPQGAFLVDMRLRSDGTAAGSVSFPPDKLDVVATSTDLYVKAPASFWATNLTAKGATSVGSRWVHSTGANDSPCLRALTSYSAVVSNFVDLPGAVTKGSAGTVDGQQAITLTLPIATVFVSTNGTALPLRVDSTASSTDGAAQDGVSFAEWNKPVTVSVPTAAESVDTATLLAR
jgi:hypothetical protein